MNPVDKLTDDQIISFVGERVRKQWNEFGSRDLHMTDQVDVIWITPEIRRAIVKTFPPGRSTAGFDIEWATGDIFIWGFRTEVIRNEDPCAVRYFKEVDAL